MAGQLGAASTVAARRCIQNDEIISNILLFQPLKTTESAENKALVNIALVCKALEEPAMNELWRDLYSFAPLLLLLPCIQLIRRTYVLTGPLGRNDWARFDHYARRVRTLFLQRSPTFLLPTVDPSVYLRIAQEHPGPVLPHLRSLFCIPLTTEAAIFLNPAFLRLIGFESDNNAMSLTFLSSVASQAPKAEDLRITLTGVFDPYIYSHIGKFHAIRKLHLTLGSGPLAEYVKLDRVLAKLGLRRFDITAPDQWETDVPNHRFEPGFADLETLGITGGFQWINATLVRVQSTDLSKLDIILTQNLLPPALNWGSLISTIFNRWWSSLHTICLDIQHSSPSADFNSLFGSIDRLRSLRTFALRRYWPMNISDKDIEKFAQNCPAMERIALVSGKDEERVA
ncbi:hypothetical protein B0H14DRAFT_1364705, partial [Mycena olivaceomarginata]